MARLLYVEVVTRSNGSVKHFELESFALGDELQVVLIQRHGEVVRLEVPVRIGARLNVVCLHELGVLSVLQSWLHVHEGRWHLELVDGVLDLHSIFHVKAENNLLSFFHFPSLVLNPGVCKSRDVGGWFVLLHKLRELPEQNYVVNMVGLQTIRNEVHIK